MPTLKLTDRAIQKIKPAAQDVLLWDTVERGLCCKITPAGRRIFCWYYRFPGGQQRRPRIGAYPDWTLKAARDQAHTWHVAVEHGEDPSQEKQTAREQLTVEQFADVYLEQHAKPHKAASSAKQDERYLILNILPAIGKRPLVSIARGDIQRLHVAWQKTPAAANHRLALLSTMFNRAIEWGNLPANAANPASRIKKYREEPKQRFLSAEELGQLAAAVGEAERARVGENGKPIRPIISSSAATAIRLLVLTGCRRNEILQLRWEHVDLARNLLNLPKSKTGKKSIYLNAAAVAVLDSIPRDPGGWICPGDIPGKPLVGLRRRFLRVCKMAKIEGLRIHDLRHSFASTGATLGLSLPILAKLLGHAQVKTTERYAHLSADPIRAASEAIGAALTDAMNRPSAEVLDVGPSAAPQAASAGGWR